LVDNICCWASERCNFWIHNIRHLAGHIREGNWASGRMPATPVIGLVIIVNDNVLYHKL
jgi:hypothetical protein